MSCCVKKNYYSPQKKTDFAVEYGGDSAKNAGSATILQYDSVPRILLFAPKLRAGTKPWFITLSISKILKNKILPVHSESSTGFNCKPNT